MAHRAETASEQVETDGRASMALAAKPGSLPREVGGPLPAPVVAALGWDQPGARPHDRARGPGQSIGHVTVLRF
jgi:hypothetical protein